MKKGLVVGLAVSVVLASVLSAQYVLQPSGRIFQAGAPLFPMEAYPPHPSSIVNFDTNDPMSNGDSIAVLAGEHAALYQVPPDKYFVLTRAFGQVTGNIAPYQVIVEDDGGFLTSKIRGTVLAHEENSAEFDLDFGPVGLVFRPGTSVTFFNFHSSVTVGFYFTGIGYLVDA